ncbi:MAG: photosynthetic reaction center subunit H [Burkholderiales bacterium]|nr:photosynthetic reaction center subunit H [Burkholderiales bacterium]
MQVGAITGYVDLAQILLYAFWIFFAGLIYYLARENHREGYPMESDSLGRAAVNGFPVPEPKVFKLANGHEVVVPDLNKGEPPRAFVATSELPGSPIEPTGNPMLDGVGPGAYAIRADVPEMNLHGEAVIRPLRVLAGYDVAHQDVDPRGLPVMGGDGKQGGIVRDIWLDTSEMLFRYLEVETNTDAGSRTVLLPMPFARVRRNAVEVNSIYGHHFGAVPGLKHGDQVTLLEEEKIMAYYGGGTLYADPKRSEPLL